MEYLKAIQSANSLVLGRRPLFEREPFGREIQPYCSLEERSLSESALHKKVEIVGDIRRRYYGEDERC
jgi:hypothetical protein